MTTLKRQGAWAVVDQVLSSGTNFVPALLVARLLGPAGFGAFSLAFLAWFGALGILRSGLMMPYTLAAAHLEGAEWRDMTRHASGLVVVAGVISGGVFAIVAVIVGASTHLGQAFLAVAVLAPGLALQEFWRVASFAAQRARTAVANDAFWAIGQVVAFAFLLANGSVSVPGTVIAWGAGAWVAGGLGVFQLSVIPSVNRASIRWARDWARIGAWFTATSAVASLGFLVIAIVVAGGVGSAGLGLFRTVQNLFGPVQLFTIGAESVFLPHLVRAIKRTTTTGAGESCQYSLLMSAVVAAYGLVLLVGAHTVLTNVFGEAFGRADVLVFPTMIAFVLDAVWSGAALLLRARANGGRLLASQIVATITRVGAVAVLIGVIGLRGAGWGLVIGSAIAAVVFWTQVARATAADRSRGDVGEAAASLGLHHADE